jgi:GNAT superfamily N-acetyltransferase
MSEATPTTATASATAAGEQDPPAWEICPAQVADVEAVAGGVRELLVELGGTPPALREMIEAARALIEDPAAGVVLVARAQAGEELGGLLAASWQTAIHVPGRYALIQDLWVRADARSQGLGAELLDALFVLAREHGMARVEVGLPRESFAHFAATEGFYLANEFTHNGPRMRRALR